MITTKTAALAATIVVILLAGYFLVRQTLVPIAAVTMDEPDKMEACGQRTLKLLDLQKPSLSDLGGIHGLCYAMVNEQDALLEFGIRRAAFISQEREKPVLMWMVVAITLSGVVLAAFQLIASYNLALIGKADPLGAATTFSVERTKLAFTSSVSGLTILVVSLAFFYIFVTQVYLVTEIGLPKPRSVAGGPSPTTGWLNPPVASVTPPSSVTNGTSSLMPSPLLSNQPGGLGWPPPSNNNQPASAK